MKILKKIIQTSNIRIRTIIWYCSNSSNTRI